MVTGHDDCKMFPDHEILGKFAKIKRFWSKLFHFLVKEKGGSSKAPRSDSGWWYIVFMTDKSTKKGYDAIGVNSLRVFLRK